MALVFLFCSFLFFFLGFCLDLVCSFSLIKKLITILQLKFQQQYMSFFKVCIYIVMLFVDVCRCIYIFIFYSYIPMFIIIKTTIKPQNLNQKKNQKQPCILIKLYGKMFNKNAMHNKVSNKGYLCCYLIIFTL